MNRIGGFFDLELPHPMANPHQASVALSTGRACIAMWLQEVRPIRCFVPFYCCDAVLQPFKEAGIDIEFYAIDDELYPIGLPENPEAGHWLYWTNFFGLLGGQVELLAKAWGRRVFVDNTHAFFEARVPRLWSFTSARKYFGVPDGAYCYRPNQDNTPPEIERFIPSCAHHLVARSTKKAEEAFGLYQESELAFDCSIKRVSLFTERLMATVDIEKVMAARLQNLRTLNEQLAQHNTFNPLKSVWSGTPFCYPFLPAKPILRSDLYSQNIFVPTLWPEVEQRKDPDFILERLLCKNLLPLPIDHRYGAEDMHRLASVILDHIR